MTLMMDALDTPEETPFISKSEPKLPRYNAERINGHGYNRITGLLEYRVRWAGPAEEDTLESYSNLRHLDVLHKYETRMPNIDPSYGSGDRKCHQQRISRSLVKYILQMDREADAMHSEEDTDSTVSELGEERQLALEGSPLLMGTPIAPTIDSPLATSEDWLQQPATGIISKEIPQWPMGENLNLDIAVTMMLKQDTLGSADSWTN
jgi:hypothetical protein